MESVSDYVVFITHLEKMSKDQLKIALKLVYMGNSLEYAMEVAKEYDFTLPAEFTPNTGTN